VAGAKRKPGDFSKGIPLTRLNEQQEIYLLLKFEMINTLIHITMPHPSLISAARIDETVIFSKNHDGCLTSVWRDV